MKTNFLFLVLFLSACGSKNAPVEENETVFIEEIKLYQLQETDKIHIDYVQYLEETDEYALPLKWKEGIDVFNWYDSIAGKLKDVIHSNELDYTRYKIPDSLIPQFFDVSTFSNVKLYSGENAHCGAGEFQRFEHIDQNIDPMPVAVYKLKRKKEKARYAVAGLESVLPELGSVFLPESQLNALVKKKLPPNYKEDRSLGVLIQGKQFYAIQGYEADGFDIYSKLFIEEYGTLNEVHKNEEYWYYCSLDILPIYQNEQPLLLVDYCKAETDWFQSGVLIFEDGKYVDWHNR